jgi:type I restriction enzyme M protein
VKQGVKELPYGWKWKTLANIFWLRDESLEDSDNLPDPATIARDIIADLEIALEQLRLIAEDVGEMEEEL